MMNTLRESIAAAMDCGDVELVDYLPYILQDFHEIGSSAGSLTRIIKENNRKEKAKIIDLGCGKGAVLLELARQVQSDCLGMDAMKAFIDYANEQAKSRGLTNCRFKVGDIRRIEMIPGVYDFIILGSIGPVFGDYYTMMERLKSILCEDGIIVLDDGYVEEESGLTHATTGTKRALSEQLAKAGLVIVREYTGAEICDPRQFEVQYRDIRKRCRELMLKHPDKKGLFADYIRKQREEYRLLEKDITSSTMLIKRELACPGA